MFPISRNCMSCAVPLVFIVTKPWYQRQKNLSVCYVGLNLDWTEKHYWSFMKIFGMKSSTNDPSKNVSRFDSIRNCRMEIITADKKRIGNHC